MFRNYNVTTIMIKVIALANLVKNSIHVLAVG
jgi:hypothetical protein